MDRQTFDRDYTVRLVASDPATQAHFSRYFGELLTIKLRSKVRSMAHVEDLRQETLLRVFQCLRRDGLHQPERLGAFVNTVANNVLFEHYRSGKREAPLPEEGVEFVSESPGPEAAFVSEESKRLLRKLLAQLPSKDQEILRMVFIAEQDKDEVCRKFGVDRGYLRVLLHRALQRLKQEYGKAASPKMQATLLSFLLA